LRRLILLAAALTAAAGADAQSVSGRPAALSRVPGFAASAPLAPLRPGLPAAPAGLNIVGVRGPGVTDEQVFALQNLADETGRAWVVHGSRQTGVSFHTGKSFLPSADLDLGVVGKPEDLVAASGERWDGVPQAKHGPMLQVDSVEDAAGRGHFVVSPRSWARGIGVSLPLQRLATPYRTAAQLAQLAAKPRAEGETFKFSVIGDAEPGRFWFSRAFFNPDTRVFWKFLHRADRMKTDFIVQLGDMVSRGLPGHFLNFFRRLTARALSTPFLTAIGNHDRRKPHGSSDADLYKGLFGGTDYTFERGGRRFVVLDTSAGKLKPGQLEWLNRTLKPKKPTVVFTHMPPYPIGEWTDFGRFKGSGGFRQGSAAFMRLMSERGVERVYVGHVHGIGTTVRDGVRYVLTGGGGSPLFPGPVKNRFHHYLTVEAGPEGLVETVHRADGSSSPLL